MIYDYLNNREIYENRMKLQSQLTPSGLNARSLKLKEMKSNIFNNARSSMQFTTSSGDAFKRIQIGSDDSASHKRTNSSSIANRLKIHRSHSCHREIMKSQQLPKKSLLDEWKQSSSKKNIDYFSGLSQSKKWRIVRSKNLAYPIKAF